MGSDKNDRTKEERELILEGAMHMFLTNMGSGWVSGKDHSIRQSLTRPGWKEFEVVQGRYRLLDTWVVGLEGKSAGHTTIWYYHEPVWVMFYAGWYEKAAIGVLMVALREAYKSARFIGGRGPESYILDGLEYSNRIAVGGSFEGFKGTEDVFDSNERMGLGKHEYFGKALI